MSAKETLLEFPTHFPIKVFGPNTELFIESIHQITKEHFPDILDEAIHIKNSENHTYVAITLTVYASNQIELDNLYTELHQHKDIKMVL
jgi:uncharacterized protein